jgi:carboxylesterase type B
VTGVSAVYGPQYLMDEDIVLVTTNYRLAALGKPYTGCIRNRCCNLQV